MRGCDPADRNQPVLIADITFGIGDFGQVAWHHIRSAMIVLFVRGNTC